MVTSVGTLGREAVESEGEVGELGEDAPLLALLASFAGAKDADMDVLVRICEDEKGTDWSV